MSKEALKILFLGMSLMMLCLAVATSLKSDMFHLPPDVMKEPWFWTTLTDFYNNIAILAAWVIYKEANWLKSVLWVLAFICLGSIATAFYVFMQFVALKPGEGIREVLVRKAA